MTAMRSFAMKSSAKLASPARNIRCASFAPRPGKYIKQPQDAAANREIKRYDGGVDVITDFGVGKDILQIKAGLNGITTAAEAFGKAKQVGDNVVIDLGNGNKIKLKNVDINDLSEDDFFVS